MDFRGRLGTGILAVMMAVSSLQLPGGVSYAVELPEEPAQAEMVEDVTEDAGTEEVSFGEDEEFVSSEEADIVDDAVNDGETVSGNQVSENDAGGSEVWEDVGVSAREETEVLVEDELEGVYQFGEAPPERESSGMKTVSTCTLGVEEYLYQQLKQHRSTIDISSYNIEKDSLQRLVSGVLNEHPDLYFVGKKYSYYSSGTKVTQIIFNLDNNLDDTVVQRATDTALATVTAGMSDLEKAIVLHDYLAVNCEYDKEHLDAGNVPAESYTIYGVFANRTAVCEGYALAYKYLLNQVGIECYMVTSSYMNHAWNMIVLDGKYYQVDVTWDDPVWDQVGRAAHTYMFRSDAAFEGHSNWQVTSGSDVVDYVATDTSYDNAFWATCKSPLVIMGDSCYYISSDRYLRKKSLSGGVAGEGAALCYIGAWTVWGGSSSWQGAFSGLFLMGDRLYYNDKSSIYSVALDGTDARNEFTADTSSGYIYGSAYCQGKVVYSLHQTPNSSAKEEVLTADIAVDGGSDDVSVESIWLDRDSLELSEGEETRLSATVFPENAAGVMVNWTSNDTAVAEVDIGGTVHAVSAGSCTITVTAGGKQAQCSVTVTAKEVVDSFNLENLNEQYKTLDDTTISSTVNGKPKLLIFYQNGCWNCQTSIGSIRDNIDDFDGLDIYAIEINNGTKESVSQFQGQYGHDQIIFSYDTASSNSSSMWRYLRKSGFSGSSAATPVICYIDAENRFQYLTQSISTADSILSNLQKYCKYASQTQESYTITYVLNGGTNHKDNPAAYTAETEDIFLKDASREGYRFDGWYEDASYRTKITTIPKGHTGNITLYAKWSAISFGNLPTIEITPTGDNIVVGFRGEYDTESAEVILEKLNTIRRNAGVYKPLKWSADLEAIARLRAVETAVKNDTSKRPNGNDYFTVTTNQSVSASIERLAYSATGLLDMIEKYGSSLEKNIINPNYNYVGVGAFRMNDGTAASDGFYRVVLDFSDRDNLNESKDSSEGNSEQHIEIAPGMVKKIQFDRSTTEIPKGGTCQLTLTVTVAGTNSSSKPADYTGTYHAGGTWTSSDEKVAMVDGNGVVTGRSAGKATITVKAGKATTSTEVIVQSGVGGSMEVTLKNSSCTYNGWEQQPAVVATVADTVLEEGKDYNLSYQNNIHVGTATVTVTGIGYYNGSVSRNFRISPAPLVIRAKDRAILIGARIPSSNQFAYEAEGLCADDRLKQKPSFSCDIVSSAVAGQYEIVPYGADAGKDYEISYESGRLRVAPEYVSHIVSFAMQGHGKDIPEYFGIRTGATIDPPEEPMANGYRFGGWFRDAACTEEWDFGADIVQSDITLYAGWFDTGSNGSFELREIGDVTYTGKACRPAVHVYDGDILLKAGRDYQIRYYNNINANEGNMRKSGNGQGAYFKEKLPYVEIIGKGNYTETVKVNFNILRADIGNSQKGTSAGVTLKVSDQLLKAKIAQKPFKSMRSVTAMRQDRDFKLTLKAVNARDESGSQLPANRDLKSPEIPAGYEGEFQLVVQGTGNYEGSISRKILVTDKEHMIKNAKVTLGKNLKNIAYADEIRLTPSEESTPDTLTVKCGGATLRPGIDYTVKYDRHPKPGKAELTIVGTNAYVGSKTVTFQVRGKTFSPKTVEVTGIDDKVYTGRAQTQNSAVLKYGEGSEAKRQLIYGTDYTISYSRNINKGTATMTFKGNETAGFSGSFKKTFKISAADIVHTKQTWENQKSTFSYCKAGVKPAAEIVLTNSEGQTLRNGRDYTLKYANNKAVAKASAAKPPTVTVKGKGNYEGILEVPFTISRADLTIENIKTVPLAFKDGKAATYSYRPGIRVMDGKTVLRAGTDYEIEYQNNTQKECESYVAGKATGSKRPQAVITGKEGSNYQISPSIVVPLPVYQNKLTKSALDVQIDPVVYTGKQVIPKKVQVYYRDSGGKKTLLREGVDYSLTYGANVKSGKNTGSVCISGIAPGYGGDVTVKFEIRKRPITGKVSS